MICPASSCALLSGEKKEGEGIIVEVQRRAGYAPRAVQEVLECKELFRLEHRKYGRGQGCATADEVVANVASMADKT